MRYPVEKHIVIIMGPLLLIPANQTAGSVIVMMVTPVTVVHKHPMKSIVIVEGLGTDHHVSAMPIGAAAIVPKIKAMPAAVMDHGKTMDAFVIPVGVVVIVPKTKIILVVDMGHGVSMENNDAGVIPVGEDRTVL